MVCGSITQTGLAIGTLLGEYRVLSRLGAGACGEVFEAEHVITCRVDAIKLLSRRLGTIPEEEQRFLREIQVQASLQHPNLAAVLHAFWTSHGLALVMERVYGEPLNVLLERGRVPLARGVSYVLGMLSGLAYAHSHGVVHRDIKPANIIVTTDGSVKLTDFGLAQFVNAPRITQCGEFVGSPCYMSPEQAIGTAPVDARSDIYSAGVVLYEILTGRLPFEGENGYALMMAHQSTPPAPPATLDPAIDPRLSDAVLRAMAKDAGARFQTAAEFRQALVDAMTPAAPAPVIALTVPVPRADLWWRAAIAAALAGGLCGTIGASRYLTHAHAAIPELNLVVPRAAPGPPEALMLLPPHNTAADMAEEATPVDDSKPRPRQAMRRAASAAPMSRPAPPPSTGLSFYPPRIFEAARETHVAPDCTGARPGAPQVALQSPPDIAPAAAPAALSTAPLADAKPAPEKRRNAVVRAFGRVFGKKDKTAAKDK